MSLNGWGGRLVGPLISYVKETDPDVLCLQEVIHTPKAHKDWQTYKGDGANLLQRAIFFAEVSAALPNHQAIFCPAVQGDLWDGEHRLNPFWGLVTFVRTDLLIIAQVEDFVHRSYSPHDYGAQPRSRNAHAVLVYNYASNKSVTIAHLHVLRDVSAKHDMPIRVEQVHRLVKIVESIAHPEDNVMVCGDFNGLPESVTFYHLAEAGLTDLISTHDIKNIRTSYYNKPGRFADYMLVNHESFVKRFDAVSEPEVSDHRTLLLEIG